MCAACNQFTLTILIECSQASQIMNQSDGSMCQHTDCLDQQKEAINAQKDNLDGTWIDIVSCQLVKREELYENDPCNVDEE